MKKNSEIIGLFKNLHSQLSINGVIEICHKIALSYIHFNYKKVHRFLKNEDLSLDEFSIEAIAPLFIKDKHSETISIKISFDNWEPTIKTDEDVLFFLNKIVASRVDQHIVSLLREEDPFFAKILDSVNYLIKSQGYKKIQSFGKTYIIGKEYEVSDTRFINQKEFEDIPSHLFKDKKILISGLLGYLEKETNLAAAIPVNELIYKLKHINFAEYSVPETSEITRKQFEMDEIINLAKESAVQKLYKSYLERGKLNYKEAESLGKALFDICEDLKNGGINPGLYEYLKPHMEELSKDAYVENYHNILEYLLKFTKRVIADNLQEKE